MQNYADVLESYLIPAEEGFVDNMKDFFSDKNKVIKAAVAAVAGIVLSVAGIRAAMNKYKTNRIFAPYLPAKAIAVILVSKKYDSVQYNTNIFELLQAGAKIVQQAETYYNELNKLCVEAAARKRSLFNDPTDAIVVLNKLRDYFTEACDTTLANIASGEEVTVTKEDAELGELENALNSYVGVCDAMITKKAHIFDAFSTELSYWTGAHTYEVHKHAPEYSLQVALDKYCKALDRFHETIINIKIKRK